MSKKSLFLVSLLCVAGIVMATQAQAQIQASGNIFIAATLQKNNNPVSISNVIAKNDLVDFVVSFNNQSRLPGGAPGSVAAVLKGTINEIDACADGNCDIPLPATFEFVSCSIINSGVASCVVDPGDPNSVIITMKLATGCPPTGGVAFPANDSLRDLVKITKRAKLSVTGNIDGEFFARADSGATDLVAYSGTTCTPGGGQGSTVLYFPAPPCIKVTKDCTPATACYKTTIDIFGEIENCGEVDLTAVKILDDKCVLDALTCPALNDGVLQPGEKCAYTGSCENPILGDNTDTVTASGDAFGNTYTAQDSATCTQKEGTPDVSIVKSCTPPVATDGNITYSIVVTNTSTGDCPVALNCRLEDTASTCDITWNGGLPVTFDLAKPGDSKTVTGSVSLPCPDQQIDCINTATVVCTAPNGTKVTKSDDATCSIPPKPIKVELNKECISAATPNDPIAYTISIKNPNADAPCQEPLTCKIVAETSDCDIEWTNLPALNTPFQVAAGQTITYSGLYSVACDHPAITCNNSISIECTDSAGIRKVSASDNASCNIPPCQEEICRTPGFWGTHAGTEKNRSQNITQAVINKVGSLTVCGETIDDTAVNSCDSAVEAICVSVKGTGQRQLVRQLTAAALNCVMSSGNADCSGVSIDQIFADCNNVCQGGTVEGWDTSKCIGAIDCFNNGGIYNNGFCQTGTCSDNGAPCSEDNLKNCGVSNGFLAFLTGVSCVPLEGNCHERELCNEEIGLCFEPPGPAGSSRACTEARGNSLYVAEGSCTE